MVRLDINAGLATRGQSQLTGRVTAAQGGAPVYDASGTLMEEYTTYTDSSGYYTITELALGTVKLHYDGSRSGAYYLPQYYNDKATLAEADPIEVASLHVQGVDVSLAEGGAILGVVASGWNNWTLDSVQIFVYSESAAPDLVGTRSEDGGAH